MIDVADRRVAFQPLDLFVFGVYRIDFAVEAAFADIAQDLTANRLEAIGCPDHGDGLWFEDFVQVVFLHLGTARMV